MRKLLLLTIGLCFVQMGFAQFEQGNIAITLGGGVGVYGASSNDPEDDTLQGINAGSGLVELDVSYSVVDQFAIGVNLERNGFITSYDTVNQETYGNSYNIRGSLTYRMVNSEKNVLYLRGLAGVSMFKFGDNGDATWVKSNGFAYEIDLGWQHHFGETVGMFMNAGWASYSYKTLTDQDGNVSRNSDDTADLKLSLFGVNARLGLLFRL